MADKGKIFNKKEQLSIFIHFLHDRIVHHEILHTESGVNGARGLTWSILNKLRMQHSLKENVAQPYNSPYSCCRKQSGLYSIH